MTNIKKLVSYALIATLVVTFLPKNANAAKYVFPVIGNSSFSNDFNGSRANGKHNAIDIIASKMQRVVSATNGTVQYVIYPQDTSGYYVVVKGTDNYCYWYLHLNNDKPGTDDGKGGAMQAYAADMRPGNPIKQGQLIGWVGDSGNAESTVSHLHFEVIKANNGSCGNYQTGTRTNPYEDLRGAAKITKPVSYPSLPREVTPFGVKHIGGVNNLAKGDVTNDGQNDTILGGGIGEEPRINIYTASGLLVSFNGFKSSIRTGVDVAAGDVDGDGKGELIASVLASAGPRIAVFDYDNGAYIKTREFLVSGDNGFKTTPRLAVGDLNGDGKDEIIAGSNESDVPRISIYDDMGTLINTTYAYSGTYTGGVDVASADVTGDTKDEIIVSRLSSSSSLIRILDNNFTKLNEFYSFGSAYKGGVHISAANVLPNSQKAEIAAVPSYGAPTISYYDASGTRQAQKYFAEEWWMGYYDVAIGTSSDFSVTLGQNRRSSIRY